MQRATPRAPFGFDGGFLAAAAIRQAAKIPTAKDKAQASEAYAKISSADTFRHPKTPFSNS
jgi:hypothetical protein